jgi:phosphatidylglycerol lysyltransferase
MAATLTRHQRDTAQGHAAPPLSAFVGDEGQDLVQLHDGIAGYVRVGRWAVMPSDPLSAQATSPTAVEDLLGRLRPIRLQPVVVATEHPDLWTRHGMHATRVADDARIDLPSFTLAGKRMAKVRHAVTSADRSGLRVEPYRPELAPGVTAVSSAWLGTKRGGELRLTLGCLDLGRLEPSTCRVALDAADRVVGFVTWRSYGNSGRVLDLMRRAPDAPNPTMDALVAQSLLGFRDDGIVEASLNAVPLSHGPLGERIYPTTSLRSYKEKFAPRWVPQWMVVPSRARSLPALVAVVKAYSPGGITQVLRRNARVARS